MAGGKGFGAMLGAGGYGGAAEGVWLLNCTPVGKRPMLPFEGTTPLRAEHIRSMMWQTSSSLLNVSALAQKLERMRNENNH